jgi:hypothetical protein
VAFVQVQSPLKVVRACPSSVNVVFTLPSHFAVISPLIIGERDVAVVSPVALNKIAYLTIDDLCALQEIRRAGILIIGVCLYKHQHMTFGIRHRHGLLKDIGGRVIAGDQFCIFGPDGCWAEG